jgi:3-oxoacyl-[acyl-carrier protein] reductase
MMETIARDRRVARRRNWVAAEPNMNGLHDKVALVTGSSRGIGAAIARVFAREGAKVVVHGRDTTALPAVQADITRAGGRAIQIAADTASFAEIEAMRHRIEQELGPVDILVANAGGSFTKPGPLEEIGEDTMSSAAARRPHPGPPIPYAAAKAGVIILTQDLAAQVGPHGIRVNCIAPETILTERNQQRIPEAQQGALVDQHAIRRLGTPEDVAAAALFLASDASAWITGIVVDVAGGSVLV